MDADRHRNPFRRRPGRSVDLMDILLLQTPDGGEITFTGGQPAIDDGLQTAIYLSLMGGNEGDDGSDGAKPSQWWANCSEPDPQRIFRSETQALLLALPAIPANLRRVDAAVTNDLAWLTGLYDSVVVTTRMPKVNAVSIRIDVSKDSVMRSFEMTMAWGAQ